MQTAIIMFKQDRIVSSRRFLIYETHFTLPDNILMCIATERTTKMTSIAYEIPKMPHPGAKLSLHRILRNLGT